MPSTKKVARKGLKANAPVKKRPAGRKAKRVKVIPRNAKKGGLGHRPQNVAQEIEVEQRKLEAYRLCVMENKTTREAGAMLGVSHTQIQDYLADILSDVKGERSRLGGLGAEVHKARIYKLLQRLMPMAERADLSVIGKSPTGVIEMADFECVAKVTDRILKCTDLICKIDGVYAPEKHELSGNIHLPLVDARKAAQDRLAKSPLASTVLGGAKR